LVFSKTTAAPTQVWTDYFCWPQITQTKNSLATPDEIIVNFISPYFFEIFYYFFCKGGGRKEKRKYVATLK